MRKVGSCPTAKQAMQFLHYLTTQKISGETRKDEQGISDIWIHDDDEWDIAKGHFNRFMATPDAEEFAVSAIHLEEALEVIKAASTAATTITPISRKMQQYPDKLTWFLIGMSTLIFLLSQSSHLRHLQYPLYISEYMAPAFVEIRAGQVWRLITPIFLHGDILHLAFNMLWLYQLGRPIENTEGFGFFSLFVVIVAVASNVAQYLVAGPAFGGMSGVVYAMLGYIYIMSRYHFGSGYFIDQMTMAFMMIWLVIGLLGIISNVANATHVGGLITGGLFGLWKSDYLKTWYRQRQYQKKKNL